MTSTRTETIVIVGGGLVGLATARGLVRLRPDARIRVLEKESGLARHQSSHNSGVLHAGLYYPPGSAKAELAVRGIRAMVSFCQAKNIRHERCGKLVVATNDSESIRLRALLDRGIANGLSGLRWLDRSEAQVVEPEVRCVAAIHVPEEGIVDYPAVAEAMAADVRVGGGEVSTGSGFESARRDGTGWNITATTGDFRADFVVNCAGLQADRVAKQLGIRRSVRIVPFRGDYFRLKASSEHLVRHLVYPVPDPSFPFLGVHFTRMIGGGVECGPSAVLSFKREGYGRTDFSPSDAADALTFSGLWRFVGRHPRMVAEEFGRAVSVGAFTRALKRLIPAIEQSDLEPGGSGVRAMAMRADGRFVEDFLFQDGPASMHVLNAPSPGATASLAIGEQIARRVETAVAALRN